MAQAKVKFNFEVWFKLKIEKLSFKNDQKICGYRVLRKQIYLSHAKMNQCISC